MPLNNINHHWQALAARLPDMGISSDSIALLPLDHLAGTGAFLKRKHAERGA